MTGVVLEQSSRADHSREHIAIREIFAEIASTFEGEMRLTRKDSFLHSKT